MLRRVGNPLGRKASLHKFTRLVGILDRWVPVDPDPSGKPQRTDIMPVRSARGFPGFRVCGVTNSRPWAVDLYGGNFYLVRIEGFEASPFNLPLHVLNHLRRCLQIRNER